MTDLTSHQLLSRLQESARRCRKEEIRRKLDLFLKAIHLGNVLKACEEFGKATSFYYYWWNRYRDAGFKIEALEEKPRIPKRFPRQIDAKVVEAIKHYRENFHYGPEKIRLYLEKDRNIRVSKATIYRVLLKEKLPLRKRNPRSFSRGPALPSPSSLNDPTLIRQLAEQIGGLVTGSKDRPRVREIHSLIQSTLKDWEGQKPPKGKKILPPSFQDIVGQRYLLERELGRGGSGIVFLARDLKSRKEKVALKRIAWEKRKDPALLLTLKNEFQALASLHHRHLARVFDFGKGEGEIYFTSEFIDGEDLLKTTSKTHLNTTFQLIVQILRGLDFLHQRGVLHLDLKPENILVTDPDKTGDLIVKLIDFGTSEWRKKGQTTHGEFVGTPPYAPPEIIQEKSPSRASDIYSLGMLLHQIFARRFPFESQDPFEMMKEQILGEPLQRTDLHPALPKDFSDLLLKMVAKDPLDRFQSPREVLEAINRSLGENFTLRSASAPVHILEESDFLFRKGLLDEIVASFAEGTPQVRVLSGPKGIGKSRFVRQMKWALQLRGIPVALHEEASVLLEALEKESPAFDSPLLIDLKENEEIDFVNLLDRLENLRLPILVATVRSRSLELNPSHWAEMKPLEEASILEFLENEIVDFPSQREGKELSVLSRGNPARLETVLQALREEGMIRWTDQGWRWIGGLSTDLKFLLVRHQARWEKHLAHVQEVLRSSRLALNAKTLEGILNIESGLLDEKLKEWAHRGLIACKIIKKIPHYLSKTAEVEKALEAPPDWPWLANEIERLYDQGAFEAGVKWADLIQSEKKAKQEIPQPVALLCARHSVAAGEADKALEFLSRSSPSGDAAERGLFHEIHARASLIRGELDEAQRDLKKSEEIARSSQNSAGLSRALNLLGSLHKTQGDFEGAEGFFTKAIDEAKTAREDYLQGLALMNLATLYHDQGRYDRAREVYERTFPLEKKTGHPLLACKLRHNWVNLLFHTGEAPEAEGHCYEWLRLAFQHRYVDQQAAALNYLALLAGQKNHREMQLHFLNQALNLLDPRLFPQLRFQMLINRGQLRWDLRQFTAAELDGEAALSLAERSSSEASSSLAFLLLGKIFRDRPHPDLPSATQHLNNARRMIWKNRIRQLKWEAEFERGLLAKKEKETERARNYFLSAQKELESLLSELPEATRQSFLRDRKQERIAQELESL